MMGTLSDEDDQFFDTHEDITSVSDSGSDCLENSDSDFAEVNSLPGSLGYDIWIKNPSSIQERRSKFLKWMGLSGDQAVRENLGDGNLSRDEIEVDTDRLTNNSKAILRSTSFVDRLSSSQSSFSRWSSDARELIDGAIEENFICRIKNLDDSTEFIVDDLGQDGVPGRLRKVGSNRLLTVEEFETCLGFSPLVQQVMRREVNNGCNLEAAKKQVKKGWLRRLGSIACIVDRQVEAGGISSPFYPTSGVKTQKVRVRSHRKRSKELSAFYVEQDIQAHEGSILTMKFSPDGRYLASAGEDGIVRVWQVAESEQSEDFSAVDIDPSHVYFTTNNLSELVPIYGDKEKKEKLKGVKKTADSACVIFPQKVFRILDTPIHEFNGHCGEVLDLAWSRNKCLLSSSVDKTVRLWQVGCDQCLKVFSHNNYVTCVQFNPVDDNYFISGSIDGKVRIWAIPGCQVVDWTDITEIVTAICYHPDGKGVIVGSMTSNCRFYDAPDNRLQQNAQVCLQGKKKSPFKRITGFQFSPTDSSKVMVTSADSQVRILHGIDVICKFRGPRNSASQIFASFTSDGMHVLSASEDSNVHVWNYVSHDGPMLQTKNKRSCESFFSNNASVAIPWRGMPCGSSIFSNISGISPSINLWGRREERGSQHSDLDESSQFRLPFSSPEHISLSHGIFPELLPKGSATWPEEKLPSSNSLVVSSAMCKSQYKFLKTYFQSTHGSPHAWGLVIVTAGWDGRIRSFQNYGLPIRG